MARRGGGCLTALAVALSVIVFAVGAALLYLVVTSGAPTGGASEGREIEPKGFSEYSWSELSEVARLIAEAPGDEEGLDVAERYGVSVGSMRSLLLDDGRQATLVVVGIRADERADGGGVAGLTLMATPIAVRPMSDDGTSQGGWESSTLRSWLADDGAELLPDELADALVAVNKRTNNVGTTSDPSAVTETADALWLFSASEVCGTITWFADEYGEQPNAYTGYVDFAPYDELLSSEGEQYEYFASAGVSATSDPEGALALKHAGAEVPWWYRTPYPYTFTGDDAWYFYQVSASGYPSSVGLASEAAGVTVGLCL